MAKEKKTKKTSSANYLHAAGAAQNFGFSLEKKIAVSNETIKGCKKLKENKKYLDGSLPPIEEVSELILKYKSNEKENGLAPSLTYYDQPSSGDFVKHRKRPGENQITLDFFGIEGSIADALMIKTVQTILEEDGHKKFTLYINNIGDKETQTQFHREAASFFKKNITFLNTNCRQYLKDSVHSLITDGGKQCKVAKEGAPVPMDFLDEQSRTNFTELVEYLETFDMPYEIDSDLLGDMNYSSHTVFKIVDEETGKVLAAGTRYDLLGKKFGIRKPMSGIIANVWLSKNKKTSARQINKKGPKIFLVQIGEKAKVVALRLIRTLHKEGINVEHKVYRDKLTPQLLLAKKIKADYLITIGYKEALDDNAIIRDSQGKSQKIIPISEVPKYLKSLK